MELKAPPKRPIRLPSNSAWIVCRDNFPGFAHIVLISRVHEVSPLDEVYPDLVQSVIVCEQELLAQEALVNPPLVNLGYASKNTHRKSTKIFGEWS